jgi:hypothetical protein
MTQYTSGTTAFNLDLSELVEEAFERCGSQLRSGYDLRTARRSLNLLTIEWANRGINLWTIEEIQIPLVAGQVCYPLPVDTIDLLDMVTRTSNGTTQQQDININRISESTYSTIPNKLTTGRPIQVWINRQSGNLNLTTAVLSGGITATDTTITVSSTTSLASSGFIQIDSETIYYQTISGNQLLLCARGQNGTTAAAHSNAAAIYQNFLPNISVYPAPSNGSSYTFVAWRLRRVQDGGTGVNIQDIPFRFVNAMVAGLSYYICSKIRDADLNRIPMLKTEYEMQFDLAASEDREKASVRFVPRNLFYSR